jgi:oxygen-independent coproporphyrinogen-3 oxidase
VPGIYIHIPFCKQACHYCNFHFSTSLKMKDEFLEALVKEINITSLPPLSPPRGREMEKIEEKTEKELVSTLYFGGGTPSILSIEDLQMIFAALQKRFAFTNDIEITLEANPDDITDEKLAEWKKIGINRLSVGLQSFLDEELRWMNRAHTAAESLICIDKITAAGFDNFSIDLIYGSPLLSNEQWKKNVDIIIEKNIPHVSCYALTVEPGTALEKMIAQHKKENVETETQANQFLLLMDWMKTAGYEHYEISNFAKPDMRSRHNSSYWSGEHYYGFGPSAHSFNGKKRKWNIANNALYIQSLKQGIIPFEEETLTATQQLNEYIMTALRTVEGIDISKMSKEEGNKILVASSKYEASGKLKMENGKLVLTNEGKLFADGIAADLFF